MNDVGVRELVIVTIPDYLVKTLASKNISLDNIGEKLSMIANSIKQPVARNDNVNLFYKYMRDNLSDHDICDFVSANELVDETLYGPSKYGRLATISSAYDYCFSDLVSNFKKHSFNEEYVEFINFMSDKTVNLDTIILNKDITAVVEYKITQNVLFIVIKSGFTNIKRFKSRDFVSYFRKLTLNSMLTAFGEKDVKSTYFFKRYLGLSGN